MGNELHDAMKVASSGLHAQSMRVRVLSENLANAQSTSNVSGGDPYRRKVISFAQELDRTSGSASVRVSGIDGDKSEFLIEHRPGHVAADAAGYVKLPNVNPLIEMADMREANRSYQANLQVVKQVREMVAGLIDLMRQR